MSFQLKASMTCVVSAMFFACVTPALAGTSPVVVTAPSDEERSTLVVKYGDLDLAVARDQNRLTRRVSSAIKEVCGFYEYQAVRTIWARRPYQACSTQAWTSARAGIAAAVSLAQRSDARSIKIADKAITVSASAGL